MGLTWQLLFSTIVIGTGSGFQHGYNIGVINAPEAVITKWLKDIYSSRGTSVDITFVWSAAVSVYCLGGILGGAMSSLFASNLGRKGALMVNNVIAMISGSLMFACKRTELPELFIAGRFITGYNCGINSGICCMYLVEISTTSMRGAIGTVYQLIITISILVSQILGLQALLGTPDLWDFLFLVVAIVGVLQFVLLPICPESPKYLYVNKGEDACRTALNWLRGGDAGAEVEEIKKEAATEAALGRATYKQMLSEKTLRKPLIISIMIMLAQQFSGINAVMFYSTKTFEASGFSVRDAQYATAIMGAMNILMTIVSLFLVDIAGRKTLLIIGFAMMFVVTSALAIVLGLIPSVPSLSLVGVVLVVLYVVAFATGPGSIPWFLVAEFFTQDARPLAASVAAATNWLANFVVGILFLPIQERIGPAVFIIFVACQLFFIAYIFICVPETKNKEYSEIVANFQ